MVYNNEESDAYSVSVLARLRLMTPSSTQRDECCPDILTMALTSGCLALHQNTLQQAARSVTRCQKHPKWIVTML